MNMQAKSVSHNSILFIDCYWDKKKNLFVRLWRYLPTTGGHVGQGWYTAKDTTAPLYGFAAPLEERKEIDSKIKAGADGLLLLGQYRYGAWESVKDSSLLGVWRKNQHSDSARWATNFLAELNEPNYVVVMNELGRLGEFETEDRKSLDTDDIIKDYFGPKALYQKKDESAYIREVERVNLKRIRDDFQKWFYSHGEDPTKIDFQVEAAFGSRRDAPKLEHQQNDQSKRATLMIGTEQYTPKHKIIKGEVDKLLASLRLEEPLTTLERAKRIYASLTSDTYENINKAYHYKAKQ